MPGKDPATYDVNEVCVWVTAIGLGNKVDQFRENAIDGAMLVDLEGDDFGELGLSSLQAKKVQKMVGFTRELASEDSAGGNAKETEAKIKSQEETIAQLKAENEVLKNENAAMKMQLEELQPKQAPPAPQSAPPPKPPPAPEPRKPQGRPVVRGAAGGAARGAVLGAVGGAIAGDAGKGAKIGAAMGATGGAMNGLGARRRARLRGRF
mmetsp:Transcript_21962/g.26480  ORF Transcript_21962/g.26480 Transcript_21962/m.26480 type:complete len:208 (-) Transcript_21962:73-696(-)